MRKIRGQWFIIIIALHTIIIFRRVPMHISLDLVGLFIYLFNGEIVL